MVFFQGAGGRLGSVSENIRLPVLNSATSGKYVGNIRIFTELNENVKRSVL